MTQTIDDLILVGPEWVDLTVNYPEMAGTDSWIINLGRGQLRVHYSSSADAPIHSSGAVLNQFGSWSGNAAHIWVECLNDSTILTVGTGSLSLPGDANGNIGTTIAGPDGTQAIVQLDGALSVQPVQGAITTMALTSGVPLALDLSTFSSAQIQITGLSADTLKIETGMDITGVAAATLLGFKSGASVLQDATALNGTNGNGCWSVAGFQGELRFTRTGSADTGLSIKVKGAN